MFGNTFKKELELIDGAIKDEDGYRVLKEYLTPFVQSEVEEYINVNGTANFSKDELLQSGWMYLDLALKKYKGRSELMLKAKNDIYYFSTYFRWYIRQGIIDYVKT